MLPFKPIFIMTNLITASTTIPEIRTLVLPEFRILVLSEFRTLVVDDVISLIFFSSIQ